MDVIERNDEVLRAIASKRRWSWDDAKVVLKALDESGVSISAFCRNTGVKYLRVLQWNQKRRQANAARYDQQTFLPLRVIADSKIQREDCNRQSHWVIQVELSDCVIRVAQEASEAVVNRVLRALRQRSC